MIVDDWAEGLTDKQQALIVEFVMNNGMMSPEVWKAAGYKSARVPNEWINSRDARIARRKFCELQFDLKKDFVKSRAAAIILTRSFFNPADIITSAGDLLPDFKENLKKLGDLAYCIEGIETYQNKFGFKVIKIKLCNRTENIRLLAELFDFKNQDDDEEFDGKKSVYELSEDEREQELKQLAKLFGYKQVKRITQKKKGK